MRINTKNNTLCIGPPAKFRRIEGFNLIEILVTLSIIASVGGAAGPMLGSLLNKSAVKASYTMLNASLRSARNHAVTSGREVYLCAISAEQSTQCAKRRDYNAVWSNGWLVFADLNDNHNFDASDELLQVTRNPGRANVVFNQRGRLRFFPSGTARSAGFYLCDNLGEETIHLQILHTGRTRTSAELPQKRKNICIGSQQ